MARRHMHRGSSRKLEGNLCDLCVQRLLDIGRHHQVSGILRITSWGHSGIIQFERGQVESVRFRKLEGERAMSELMALRDGIFELVSATPISLDAPVPAARPARMASPVLSEPEPVVPRFRVMDSAPVEHTPVTLAAAPHFATSPQAGPQQAWPRPDWDAAHQSQPAWPAWPQQHLPAAPVPSLTSRLPPLGPALGFGFLGFMLLIMVAIQL